ncbi:hypothetical protein JQ621_18105 [Bradyrhizobium manausense]|jgi:hypothetical protein|uniref:hypothetical protein n=1 Tax=Bradyrhizobium manausense TaxID=989370 RepID=UPI001BAA3531|nr:hypothetical protein [Bradyrhizobium manausense]MBR1089379.1 hypothetical protein [Bradyrhizobium manausense]
MPINPKSWAADFTEQLIVGDEHVPLDRVVARHADAFTELRELGMTWGGISQLLMRAGALRADGSLISSDQLRVAYARVGKRTASTEQKARRHAKAGPARAKVDAPPLVTDLPSAPASVAPSDPEATGPQDVSGNEIEAALARLNKIGPTGEKK